MESEKHFDVIIIGGSYAGLSAAMALGRSLRQVLIIDSGQPCNRQTPHSHNLIISDGATPAAIAAQAKDQVLKYPTVSFVAGKATKATKSNNLFKIAIETGDTFTAKKLLFATGLKDIMPAIDGFSQCWGISVLHCPYCHGYEVNGANMGVLANGELGFEFSKLISNWTKNLVLFTNGTSTLTAAQTEKLASHNIAIIEKEIEQIAHEHGQIKQALFKDGSSYVVTALFAKAAFSQHCELPVALGCALTEQGLIAVDDFVRTTVPGIFAAGDCTTMFRAVSIAIAAGTQAGAIINKELVDDSF